MNNIKYLRDISGITQQQLGKMMGVSKQNVCNYEKNLSQPPVKRVKLAIEELAKKGFVVSLDKVYEQPQDLKQAS